MSRAGSVLGLRDLRCGTHACLLYETEAEHRAVVTEFIELGLERGEKLIYVRDAHSPQTIESYLGEHLDIRTYVSRGQLNIMSFADAYMYGSTFDPERMIRLVRNETEIAVAEGWSGLRTTVEMTWVLKRWPGSNELAAYESRSNSFYGGSKCIALCQYDCRNLNPALLLHALSTHPVAAIGQRVYENPFYRAPVPTAGRGSNAALLKRRLKDLRDVPKVVETRARSARRSLRGFSIRPTWE
jgi:hypothetical protein